MSRKKSEPKEIKQAVKPMKKGVKAVKNAPRKRLVKKETPLVVEKGLTAQVIDTEGKAGARVGLSEAIFAAKVKPEILTQAVRVYRQNQRQGTQSTKTRGEVSGSTRKIRPQKGSGHARHGSLKAPIFVGGGIALGPKPRDLESKLPRQMRRQALFGALTQKFSAGEVKFVSGLDGLKAKTREMVQFLKNSGLITQNQKKTAKILLVISQPMENIILAGRNIPYVTVVTASLLNTYDVLAHKHILIMREALKIMEKTFLPGKQQNKNF